MFDLDGTLIDSAYDLVSALNDVVLPIFKSEVPYEKAKRLAGIGSRYLLRFAFEHFNTPYTEQEIENLVPAFMDAYETKIQNVSKTFNYAEELLKCLKQKHQKTILLITNKPRRFTPTIINQLNWTHYFDGIYCPEDVSARKPNPQHLLEALDKHSQTPQHALMVGDSIADYQSALDAGIDMMMVGFYNQTLSEFPKSNFFIQSYRDVIERYL
jgi:phosphoglycolate phosphatase